MYTFGNNIFSYTHSEYIQEDNAVIFYGLDDDGKYAVFCLEDGNLTFYDMEDNCLEEFLVSS
jgi:hypothetical protein